MVNSDSRAAILSLQSKTVKSRLVSNTIVTLNELAQSGNAVTFRWVRAHTGHEFNELVDRAAKDGALDIDNLAPDVPMVSKTIIRTELRQHVVRLWNHQWAEKLLGRQTKFFFPTTNLKFSKALLTQNRHLFSVLVRLITGHAYLRRHNAIVEEGHADLLNAGCRFCQEDVETPHHILADCPLFVSQRMDNFGTYRLSTPFTNMSVQYLTKFLRDIQYEVLEDPE